MTRRLVWLGVLVLALLALGSAWFLHNFERVPVKEREAPQREARQNPYLALERFLARMGRPVLRESNAQALDRLPPGGVLFLDKGRRHHLTPARQAALLRWVQEGGYLLLVPEFQGVPDPLLEALGAEWFEAPETDAEEDDPPARKPPRLPPQLIVRVPGSDTALAADFRFGLVPGSPEPEWQAGHPDHGQQLLHYARGRGHVAVVVGLDGMLSNWRIGERDHAELLWALLQRYQPQGTVMLVSRLEVPSLWDWLAESAWAACIAAAALLVLWLWRIVPRFGPIAPELPPARRELREHLAAVGRFLWRSGGLGHWLAVARGSFLARLALRHPAIAALPAGEQAAALAQLTGRPAQHIAAALHGPAATPAAFTEALRLLQRIQSRL